MHVQDALRRKIQSDRKINPEEEKEGEEVEVEDADDDSRSSITARPRLHCRNTPIIEHRMRNRGRHYTPLILTIRLLLT